jgi:hypothetical protein
MRKQDIVPAYLNQRQAADYLGVSVAYFAKNVDVVPVPFPSAGEKPLERYARAELDAWADRWRDPKARRAVG